MFEELEGMLGNLAEQGSLGMVSLQGHHSACQVRQSGVDVVHWHDGSDEDDGVNVDAVVAPVECFEQGGCLGVEVGLLGHGRLP